MEKWAVGQIAGAGPDKGRHGMVGNGGRQAWSGRETTWAWKRQHLTPPLTTLLTRARFCVNCRLGRFSLGVATMRRLLNVLHNNKDRREVISLTLKVLFGLIAGSWVLFVYFVPRATDHLLEPHPALAQSGQNQTGSVSIQGNGNTNSNNCVQGVVGGNVYCNQSPRQPDERFVGKWRAERIDLNLGSFPGGMSLTSELTRLGGPLSEAAFHGPNAFAQFEVNDFGQYHSTVSGEDRGTVSIASQNIVAGQITFISSLNGSKTTVSYVGGGSNPTPEPISVLGGKVGDSVFALNWPYGQVTFVGKPASLSQGVIGHWHIDTTTGATVSVTLDIMSDGTYKYRVQVVETGMWEALDGRWTQTPLGFTVTTGTYKFQSQDTVVCVAPDRTFVWRRI